MIRGRWRENSAEVIDVAITLCMQHEGNGYINSLDFIYTELHAIVWDQTIQRFTTGTDAGRDGLVELDTTR